MLFRSIDTKTLPDQGPDVYKKGMDQSERDSLRKETAKYRYVKIEMSIIFPEVKPIEPHTLNLDSNTVTLIKTIEDKSSIKRIPHTIKPTGKHLISKDIKPCKVNVNCVTGF